MSESIEGGLPNGSTPNTVIEVEEPNEITKRHEIIKRAIRRYKKNTDERSQLTKVYANEHLGQVFGIEEQEKKQVKKISKTAATS